VEEVDKVKGGGYASLPPSASWAENTIINESPRELAVAHSEKKD
jgi:hypothetical protein